jgi:hypothetical protein
MKTPNAYIKVAVSLLAAAILTATSGRADTYSWTNYQSDIAGVAHNPNLINPWGMAVGSSGYLGFIETLMRADGTPLQFDGLWDMLPLGNGVYFTAGIADESHGLFGIITED